MGKLSIEKKDLKNVVTSIIREEQIKFLNERWSTMSKQKKLFIVETIRFLYPENPKLINEATGFNTALDIAGVFDPTGAIDLYNGFDYWEQGDHLFAILSWISVFPYLGDLIAKPIIGLAKFGSESFKTFNIAFKLRNASKMAEIAGKEPKLAEFLTKSPSWGEKLLEVLRNSVGRIPLIKRAIPLIEEYIKLFKTAGKSSKLAGAAGKTISAAERETLISSFRGFRNYGGSRLFNWFRMWGSKDYSMYAKFVAGVPRLFGNAATRSLMRRTKWYLGLLNWLGIADTKTDPEEIIKTHSDEVQEYANTEEAQKSWMSEFGEDPSLADNVKITSDKPEETNGDESNLEDSIKQNLFSTFFKSILS